MRELIGNLVACRGAEQAAARMAVGIPQRFPCKQFLCKGDRADHALIHDDSVGAGTSIPISVVHPCESFTVAAIAGAIPGFGVLD
jgi:hypothetical protein